jgi:hypothetical protein
MLEHGCDYVKVSQAEGSALLGSGMFSLFKKECKQKAKKNGAFILSSPVFYSSFCHTQDVDCV